MNRREAFQTIGVALAGTVAEGSAVKAQDTKPQMVVIKFREVIDPDAISVQEVARLKLHIQEICEQAGWGKDFPVMIAAPGIEIDFEPKPAINVVIPPNTIVEQLGKYTAIYPVGHRPCT